MFSTCGSEESPIIEQELVAQIVESRWLSENCLFAFFFYLVGIFCSCYHQKDENSGGTKRDESGKAWNIFAMGEEFNLRDTLSWGSYYLWRGYHRRWQKRSHQGCVAMDPRPSSTDRLSTARFKALILALQMREYKRIEKYKRRHVIIQNHCADCSALFTREYKTYIESREWAMRRYVWNAESSALQNHFNLSWWFAQAIEMY